MTLPYPTMELRFARGATVSTWAAEMSGSHEVRTGADLIAEFIARHCNPTAYLVTGGACAFIVDAIGRNPQSDYVCFQHEQAAAMAADAVWRVSGRVGVTVVTSGPGATNLITGIACSWFDSIPTLHISGQVNDAESSAALGVDVRQAGFQETDIVAIVAPVTKYAVKVHTVGELGISLRRAFEISQEGRMGPVLIDVPMNVQKEPVSDETWELALAPFEKNQASAVLDWGLLEEFISEAQRPLVVVGAGTMLSGVAADVQAWCERSGIPYVTSWGAMPHLDRSLPLYQGSHGVYGSRHANWVVQAADRLLVLGSRLDNRQRTGNPIAYAPFADVLVIDIDDEELGKFRSSPRYRTHLADLGSWTQVQRTLSGPDPQWPEWRRTIDEKRKTVDPGTSVAVREGELNPYEAVSALQSLLPNQCIVVSDCGANLCWVYQDYQADSSYLFTAAGNSPMGYALPAAIGAQLTRPDRRVWCFIGDGGLQMNVQELQTIVHHNLEIVIVILNNQGYGIIKQFQDAYFDGRHEATGRGYSFPDFRKIANAYGIDYTSITSVQDIEALDLPPGPVLVDVNLPPGALITPKIEMDRFLHDQFPYMTSEFSDLPFDYPDRPSQFGGTPSPNV